MNKLLSELKGRVPAAINGPPDIKHLNQIDLARRWRISPRTLERWRWLKQGPAYVKLGGHVVYRLEDIEAYEAAQLRQAPERKILGQWR
jgi:hypothetical protein